MPALVASSSGAALAPRAACSRTRPAPARMVLTRAAEPKQDAPSTSAPPPPATPEKPTVVREYTANGARIVESDATLKGPEDEKDFWEGENMEAFGKVMERFFIPGLVVLGLVCGSIAARSYNEDADVFIAPANGPDADIVIIPAGALAPAPVVAPPVASE